MALLHLATALVLLCLSGADLCAQEPPPQAPDVEVRFVPGGSGTVSLGIFDATGRLVRVLSDEWTFDRFRAGRDALSTDWDGVDAHGKHVPPGTYVARGYIVGDIDVSGEAFHFNDWIDDADSPRIVSVGGSRLLPGGDILLVARLAGAQGALVRYSPGSDVRWNTVVKAARPQAARSLQLAVSDTMAFVLLDGRLGAVKLGDGSEVVLPAGMSDARAVAARGVRLAILRADGLKFFALPDFTLQGGDDKLPAEFTTLAMLEDGMVASAADGSVWLRKDAWSRVDMPEDVRIRGVSGGRGDTFWTWEEQADGSAAVALYSPEEGRLAEWRPGPQDGKLTAVAGAADRDYFVATLAAPDVQRTVAIRRKDGGEGWEYVFDKKITASADFGWADGKLAASSAEVPTELRVPLAENPLDPTAPRNLTLRAVADESGTCLMSTDGLPLLRISDEPVYGRVMLTPGASPDSARFFQGDGACVEEYAISRLGEIMSFDAGTIEMTESGEASPPPPVDPDDPNPPQ